MFDDDVPIRNSTKAKYHLEGIQVGQSKWFEYKDDRVSSILNLRASLISSALYSNREVAGVKFSSSREKKDGKDGIRIWRVA